MNRLGIGINTTKQNNAEFTATPADLPVVGDPGAANGVVIKVEQIGETTLEVTEAVGGNLIGLAILANNYVLGANVTNPFVTNQDYVDAINTFLGDEIYLQLPPTFGNFELNQNTNELLEYEDLTNTFQFNVINTETSNSLIDAWKDYVIAGIIDSYYSIDPTAFSYVYLDTSGGETALNYITYTNDGNLIAHAVNFSLADNMADNENSIYSLIQSGQFILLPIPFFTRTYKIVNVSILAEGMMPAVIPSMNLYPSEYVSTFTSVDQLATYALNNNGLDAQTLPQVLDRYRPANSVKPLNYDNDTEEPGNLIGGGIRVADNIFGGNDTATALVTFSQKNLQITIKLVYTGSNKPPAPYFDRAASEKLTLHCDVLCFKDVANVKSLLETLSLLEVNRRSIDERTTQQGVPITIAYQGTTDEGLPYFYSESTFKLDVSDIVTIDHNGEETTVYDLAATTTNAINAYSAMVFEIRNIRLSSNVRSGSTRKINYIQTGLITVPTFKGLAFEVGTDMSSFFTNTDEAVANKSLKPGVTPMSTSLEFNTDFGIEIPEASPVQIDFFADDFYTYFILPVETTTGGAGINQIVYNNSSNTVYYDIDWDLTVTDLDGVATSISTFIRLDLEVTASNGAKYYTTLAYELIENQIATLNGNFFEIFGFNYPILSGASFTFKYKLYSYAPANISLEFLGTVSGTLPSSPVPSEGAPPISQSPPPSYTFTEESVTNPTTIRPNFYY